MRKFFATHPGDRDVPIINAPAFQGPFVGPGVPVTPDFGAASPRYFDYVSGVNANVIPRTEYNGLIPNFWQLWATYLSCDIIRVAMTHRTQSILSLSWNITTRQGSGFRSNARAEDFRRLMDRPDPQNGYNFEGFFRSCLQEIYVTDALTVYPVRNKLGRVIAFMQVDGQTIKPLLDYARGGIPAPPDAAYIQYIKGSPYTAFTSEQLYYRPFRPRPWCIYGESRVENILNTALLYNVHDQWVGDYFLQGNIPEAAALIDPTNADITDEATFKSWQTVMDQMHGQNVARRRVHLMPNFVKTLEMLKSFTFDKELPTWLARILTVEWGMPSSIFASETNRATAKEVNKTLYEPQHRADLLALKRFVDELARVAGYPELEFNWSKDLDYSEEAVKGLIALSTPAVPGESAIMTRDEVRIYLGLATDDVITEGNPATDEEADEETDDTTDQTNKVLSFKSASPTVGGEPVHPFQPPAAQVKSQISAGLAGVVLKRMRQSQSAIMKNALERARARQKKVRNV
jgi:hypothetical protein